MKLRNKGTETEFLIKQAQINFNNGTDLTAPIRQTRPSPLTQADKKWVLTKKRKFLFQEQKRLIALI